MLLFGELSSFNGIDSTGESPDSPAWGCGRRTGSADTASNLGALNAVAVPALAPEEGAVYLIDEIGKMECLSGAFTDAVARWLDEERR